MGIIAISGKKSSGKDTVGKIIQILIDCPHFTNEAVIDFLKRKDGKYSYLNKKFADPLKDMICILLGCTREQLEDEEFKSKELPEQWWYWLFERNGGYITQMFPYSEPKPVPRIREEDLKLVKPTPRLLLQLMGTECGREILHPNLWVNALFSQYQPILYHDGKGHWINPNEKVMREVYSNSKDTVHTIPQYPKWIITDMRFPNELKAVQERNGITIRVNRPEYSGEFSENYRLEDGYHIWYDNEEHGNVWSFSVKNCTKEKARLQFIKEIKQAKIDRNINSHESETALDSATLQYVITNDGDKSELIDKVKEILIKEKLYKL